MSRKTITPAPGAADPYVGVSLIHPLPAVRESITPAFRFEQFRDRRFAYRSTSAAAPAPALQSGDAGVNTTQPKCLAQTFRLSGSGPSAAGLHAQKEAAIWAGSECTRPRKS